MLPLEHSAILLTCILKANIGLGNQFSVFLRVAVLHRFYCTLYSIHFQALTTAFYTLMLYTLGTYYYAMKSQDWGGYAEVQSRSNIHLRLDFAALMIMGVLMFALPQWVLRLQVIDRLRLTKFLSINLTKFLSISFNISFT